MSLIHKFMQILPSNQNNIAFVYLHLIEAAWQLSNF